MQTPNIKKKAENISTAQIERIRRNLRFALLTMTQQIPEKEKEQFKKDVHGLKYKSSSTKVVYLSVPKRKQKAIIDKHYLKKINDLFNRNGKTKYKLEIVVSKPNIWIPILCGGLATTLAATGTAVYFALTPVMYKMTLHIGQEATIRGLEDKIDEFGNLTYELKKGSFVSEIPKPIMKNASSKLVFYRWVDGNTNREIYPGDEIEPDMYLVAEYQTASSTTTIEGGTTLFEEKSEGVPLTDEDSGIDTSPWVLSIDGEAQEGVTWDINPKDKGVTINSTTGYVSYNGVAPGTTQFVVTGTKGEDTASANITFVIEDAKTTVDFVAPTDLEDDIDFEGETHFDVVKFRTDVSKPNITLFKDLNPPIPKMEGYHLEFWTLDDTPTIDSTPISPEAHFEGPTNIYPFMAQTVNPYIEGGSTVIHATVGDDGEDPNLWQLYDEKGVVVPASQLTWEDPIIPEGLSGDVWIVTEDNGIYVIWNTTTTVDDIGEHQIVIRATYKGVEYRKTVTISIEPAVTTVTFKVLEGSDIQLVGQKTFDVVMTTGGVTPEKGATTFSKLNAPNALLDGYQLDGWTFDPNADPIVEIQPNQTWDSSTPTDIYPVMSPIIVPHFDGGKAFLHGQAGVQGGDNNPWHLYEGDQVITTGLDNWDLSSTEIVPSWIQLIPPTGDESGRLITWTNAAVAGEYTFDLTVEYKGIVYSQTITLVIETPSVALSFAKNTGQAFAAGTEFYGPTTLNVPKGTKWPSVDQESLPHAYIPGDDMHVFDHWSTTENTDNPVTDSTEFNAATTLYAWFADAPITDITIEGSEEVVSSQTSQYQVVTTPEGFSPTVTWSVQTTAGWVGTAPSINGGLLTTSADSHGTCTIKAVYDPGEGDDIETTIDVIVKPPYEVEPKKTWTMMSNGNATTWYSVDTDDLCNTSASTIHITPYGGAETTTTRATFNSPLTIGAEVNLIGDDYLANCAEFNSPIVFAPGSQCIEIGDNFMYGCAKFNKKLELPNSIRYIGDAFLFGATQFANEKSATKADTFNLPTSLKTIGEGFMYECKAFNSSINIATTVEGIGNTFLFGCEAMSSGETGGKVIFANGFNFERIASSSSTPLSFAITYTAGTTHSIIIDCSGDDTLKTGLQGKFKDITTTTVGAFYRVITWL